MMFPCVEYIQEPCDSGLLILGGVNEYSRALSASMKNKSCDNTGMYYPGYNTEVLLGVGSM